jgi:ATP-binding cassette, subfamily B (MDR/TAP), member 1
MEKANVDGISVPVTEEGNAPPTQPKVGNDGRDDDDKYSSKAENKVSFWDYARIFSYSTTGDRFLMIAAGISSIGTGVTLPLMNLIFSQFVSNFNDYFKPGTNVTKDQFLDSIKKNTYGRFPLLIDGAFN